MLAQLLKITLWLGLSWIALMGTSVIAGAIPSYVGNQKVPSLAPMLERAIPAVVNIATEGRPNNNNPVLRDPFFQRFLNNKSSGSSNRPTDGTGSGVIIHSRLGHILTNYHVVEAAERISVTLHDKRRYDASIVGTDPRADLALLRIDAPNLTGLPFGDSSQLRVGDFVVAIGNPYGIGQTVTSGIVSALHRNLGLGEYENFIQTDASINLGNSGGALVNLKGELVGVNTAILGGQNGGNIGIAFAIPINTVASVIDQITRYGTVERGKLGVEVTDITHDIAEQAGLEGNTGAMIKQVFENSPALNAGLQAGDIIVRIDNQNIFNASDAMSLISTMRPGSEVSVTFVRGGSYFLTTATLDKS